MDDKKQVGEEIVDDTEGHGARASHIARAGGLLPQETTEDDTEGHGRARVTPDEPGDDDTEAHGITRKF